MEPTSTMTSALETSSSHPQGSVLKGQYTGVYRSSKGKLKGLRLKSGTEEYTIKLPKYLRPMLVRELEPETFIQVWAYPDEGIWRGINILPLPEAEISKLQQLTSIAPSQQQPQSSKGTEPKGTEICIQICRKGTCFKKGSKAILQILQAEVESNPNLQHISIEATGCMKSCKKGPNLRIMPSGKELNHVNQNTALAVLSKYQ